MQYTSDYISRQAAIDTADTMLKRCDTESIDDYHDLIVESLSVLPSADVQPVRHGRWLIPRFGSDARCSECGMHFTDVYDIDNYDRFCRHCGAVMEGIGVETEWMTI